MTIADIPALRDIDRLSFGMDDQYTDEQYTRAVTSESSDALGVVVDGGSIIAWALIDRACVPVRIRSLAVRPEFRRRGVGAMLVDEAIARYGRPIDLVVDPTNTNAIAFYENRGFEAGVPDPQLPQRICMVRT